MKNKKADSKIFYLVLVLIIIAIVIVMFATEGRQWLNLSDDIIDSKVMTLIAPSQDSDSQAQIEERIALLGDVRFEGEVSNEYIKYGQQITKHFFNTVESDSTNGFLMTFPVMPSENMFDSDSDLFFMSIPDGILVGYYDNENKQTLRLASPATNDFEYLKGSEICVLPINDEGEDAAKVLSFATGIKRKGVNTLPSRKEVLDIMSANVVDQITLQSRWYKTKDSRKDTVYIKYFKGDTVYKAISEKNSKTDKLLAYSFNDIVCIFPPKMGGLFSHSHVDLTTKSDEYVLMGEGNIYTSFINNLVEYSNSNTNIKINKGEFNE